MKIYIIHLLKMIKFSMAHLIYSQLVLPIGKSFVSIIIFWQIELLVSFGQKLQVSIKILFRHMCRRIFWTEVRIRKDLYKIVCVYIYLKKYIYKVKPLESSYVHA